MFKKVAKGCFVAVLFRLLAIGEMTHQMLVLQIGGKGQGGARFQEGQA